MFLPQSSMRHFVTSPRKAPNTAAQPSRSVSFYNAKLPPAPTFPLSFILSVRGPVSVHACIQAIPTSISSHRCLCLPLLSSIYLPCLEVNSPRDSTQVPRGPPGFSSHPHLLSEAWICPSPSVVSSSGLSGSSPSPAWRSLRRGLLHVTGWS